MRFLYYIVVILHCISFVFVNCISCIAYCEIEPAYRKDKLTYVAKAARYLVCTQPITHADLRGHVILRASRFGRDEI